MDYFSVMTLDDILASSPLDDERIEPMPCCGRLIPLGDVEFGENLFCPRGRCVTFVCVCGKAWASVEAMGCPCRREGGR